MKITENDYFIEKGTISIKNNNKLTKYIFNLKCKKTEDYLISIRNTAGIEGAKVFLTEDTVLVNDRINKRVLFGNPADIEKISGYPLFLIKIALGDLILNEKYDRTFENCKNNKKIFIVNYQGKLINQTVDCIKKRPIITEIEAGITNKNIKIYFKKYLKNERLYPVKIEIVNEERNINIRIKIERLTAPWEGNIEFMPGKGYELKRL
jgi:hypothetical protein